MSVTAAPRKKHLLLPGQWEAERMRAASSGFLLPVGTAWVERDVLGIADEINARWPNLRVASCSCGQCIPRGHAPHAVLEHCRDGLTRPVFTFTRFSRDVIDRLHAIHVSQDPYAQHEAHNRKVRAEIERKQKEERDAALEEPIAALKSSKSSWRGSDGKVYSPHGVRKVK